MPQARRYLIHSAGPALWPEHKPLSEVLELERTTPDFVWQTTWQGRRAVPGGSTYKREWWQRGRNRFNPTDAALLSQVIARWESWDTGYRDNDTAAYSACIVGDLLSDYRLAIREVYRERLELPSLVGSHGERGRIEEFADRYYGARPPAEPLLRGVVIEDKASGISAVQTLRVSGPPWLAELIRTFDPRGLSKDERGRLAAVWCAADCLLLPEPGPSVPWLHDFEQELYSAPNGAYMDMADAFAQLILYLEHYLAEGQAARRSRATTTT